MCFIAVGTPMGEDGNAESEICITSQLPKADEGEQISHDIICCK